MACTVCKKVFYLLSVCDASEIYMTKSQTERFRFLIDRLFFAIMNGFVFCDSYAYLENNIDIIWFGSNIKKSLSVFVFTNMYG